MGAGGCVRSDDAATGMEDEKGKWLGTVAKNGAALLFTPTPVSQSPLSRLDYQ